MKTATSDTSGLYGACPNVLVTIGDVQVDEHFFVQENASYLVTLGEPYITAVRMETTVLDVGSAYARVRSQYVKKAVHFLTVRPNHERHRDCNLRNDPMPIGQKEFGNHEIQDFRRGPLQNKATMALRVVNPRLP